jgi:hypothetical protein
MRLQTVALFVTAAIGMIAQRAGAQVLPTAQRPGETPQRTATLPKGPSENFAAIKGRVVAVDGRPLGRVQIQLVGSGAGNARRGFTDADGQYEIDELPADAYTVTASKTGYVTAEFGQRRFSYPGTQIRLREGERIERIDFTLVRAGAITGRVADENGDPVQGASVTLLQLRFVNGRRTLADVGRVRQTDDQGHFRVYGVQPGRYAIVASAASTGPTRLPGYAPTFYPSSISAADAELVTVTAGADDVIVELRLAQGRVAKLSGIALDADGQPYRGRVYLAPSARAGGVGTTLQATVQPDGQFEFINVTAGDYLMQTSFPGPFASQFVTVASDAVRGLTLRTSLGSVARGRITFEGSRARLRPQDMRFYFVLTDPDRGPMPGTYRAKILEDWTFEYVGLFGPLVIRPDAGQEWLIKSVRVGDTDFTDTPMPFGRQDQSLTDIEVVMTKRSAGAAGRVTDAHGQTVTACTVMIFAVDSSHWQHASRFVKLTRCEADGTFAIRGLPTGEYFAAAVDRLEGTDAAGEWEDPAVLDSLTPSAVRLRLIEGQIITTSLRLVGQ